MPWVVVRHKVKDYASWRPAFDRHVPGVKQFGGTQGLVLHTDGDPNEIWVCIECDNLARMREFTQSPNLRQAMEESGVVETPDVYFLKELPKAPI